MNKEINYWQPRVMRHIGGRKGDEYAIHEVYFDKDDNVVTYTSDALSPLETSVINLKNILLKCLNQVSDEIALGDSQYPYSRKDIEFWLSFIDESPIDYK